MSLDCRLEPALNGRAVAPGNAPAGWESRARRFLRRDGSSAERSVEAATKRCENGVRLMESFLWIERVVKHHWMVLRLAIVWNSLQRNNLFHAAETITESETLLGSTRDHP